MNTPKTVTVCLSELHDTVERALITLGLTGETLSVVQQVLMYAQKRGSTQGLAKIKERTVLPDPDYSAVVTTRRSVNIAHLDGCGNVGMLVLQKAAEQAITLTRESGLALITTNNTRSSTGAIGYYARQLASQGYIGIVLAGSPKVMAVSGGIDPVLGTNPIAIAIPTSNAPLVLDMATAATTWFALLQARDQQTPIANDVAVDHTGEPTTSAEAAIAGALRTFGGNKGSGLALMFELLTGPLTHAGIAGDEGDNRGNLVIGIDPAVVLGDDSFVARTDTLLATIREGRRNSKTPIRLPGDHSEALAQQCEQDNLITLDQALYKHIVQLAEG